VDVYIGGNTASQENMADKIAERLPFFIGAVAIVSILFLIVVFRSVWVPLVSAAFNLLSIAAAYGVVGAIFPWQWGSSLLGSTARCRSSRSSPGLARPGRRPRGVTRMETPNRRPRSAGRPAVPRRAELGIIATHLLEVSGRRPERRPGIPRGRAAAPEPA
jgi:hypothetical protein